MPGKSQKRKQRKTCPNCGSLKNKSAKIDGRLCSECGFAWSPDEIRYLKEEDLPERLLITVIAPETGEVLWSTFAENELSLATFEKMVDEHWKKLVELVPERIRENITYVVEEDVSAETLKQLNASDRKQDMSFGLFQGVPLKHGVIKIYKKPIERYNFMRHELIDRHTFLVLKHELLHFLGMGH